MPDFNPLDSRYWHENYWTVISVASFHLKVTGRIFGEDGLMAYLERPWAFDDLYVEWAAENAAEGTIGLAA